MKCKHDLEERDCEACRPIGNEFASAAGPLGGLARAVAQFAGECPACTETIEQGDAIVCVDGVWVHEGCES